MEDQDQAKADIIKSIIMNSPRPFWSDFPILLRQTYRDTFEQVAHDSLILPAQKLDYLFQLRHFRVEQLLQALAERHGLPATPTLLVENHRSYVMVGAGEEVAFTQAYVSAIGEMPKPARFREKHSAMNDVARVGRLALGDQPEELLKHKNFYGIICHNPVGRRFEQELQMLGMVQFCVPEQGCREWLAELTFQEIVATYDTAKRQRVPRGLRWRKDQKKQDNSGE